MSILGSGGLGRGNRCSPRNQARSLDVFLLKTFLRSPDRKRSRIAEFRSTVPRVLSNPHVQVLPVGRYPVDQKSQRNARPRARQSIFRGLSCCCCYSFSYSATYSSSSVFSCFSSAPTARDSASSVHSAYTQEQLARQVYDPSPDQHVATKVVMAKEMTNSRDLTRSLNVLLSK